MLRGISAQIQAIKLKSFNTTKGNIQSWFYRTTTFVVHKLRMEMRQPTVST